MKRSLMIFSALCSSLVVAFNAGAAQAAHPHLAHLHVRAHARLGAKTAAVRLAWPAVSARQGRVAKIGPTTPVEQPAARSLAVTVNGEPLAENDGAALVGGRVYVPLRAVANALHIGVRITGPHIEMRLPSNEQLFLQVNSQAASLGREHFQLPTPVLVINNRIALPIHLFVRAFGAVVRYNDQSAQVAILARLERRPRVVTASPPVTGTISALDLLSNPQTVSLVVDDRIHTLPLRVGTPITTEDVVSGTRQQVGPTALHAGDVLTVSFSANGSIAELAASYRSRNGTVAAVAARALALADGRVVTPSRGTTVTLNGMPVGLSGLHVGDTVTIRSNPDTLEVREILAARPLPAVAAGPVSIRQLTFVPTRPLRGDQELQVYMRGTPGGSATFTIGGIAGPVPMREIQSGLYSGRYLVVPGVSFLRAPVTGELSVRGVAAPPASADAPFSAATLPPQIVETAPADGQTVNAAHAAIYAVFTTPTGIPIDPGSITMNVNGVDVTAKAQRAPEFVTYTPAFDLPRGQVNVAISVADVAGNVANYHWSFSRGNTIGLREPTVDQFFGGGLAARK